LFEVFTSELLYDIKHWEGELNVSFIIDMLKHYKASRSLRMGERGDNNDDECGGLAENQHFLELILKL
jgi:hypothetical protein